MAIKYLLPQNLSILEMYPVNASLYIRFITKWIFKNKIFPITKWTQPQNVFNHKKFFLVISASVVIT